MITNQIKFSSFLSDEESKGIIRQANLILLEEMEFFNEVCDIIIESKMVDNGKNRIGYQKDGRKVSEIGFEKEGIYFSLWELNYNMKGEDNEIERIFDFTLQYSDKNSSGFKKNCT